MSATGIIEDSSVFEREDVKCRFCDNEVVAVVCPTCLKEIKGVMIACAKHFGYSKCTLNDNGAIASITGTFIQIPPCCDH